jgi:cellulose synthase/poly-beta-1,6-N-acetylglucosamine synthase-like glycosyltransferase
MQIAVIIPTLNEAQHIAATVGEAIQGGACCVIVADCDSSDKTVELARDAGATVLTGKGLDSRAAALQAGLESLETFTPEAKAVWFLHADTAPPKDWHEAITQSLADPAVVGGAFAQRFNTRGVSWLNRRLLRFTIFCNRTRYRITGIYFGDQGIFARRSTLDAIGGIPQAHLLEDVDLCRALKKHGRLFCLPQRITTSPRRFLKHGIIRQLLRDWYMLLLDRLGRRPAEAMAHYNRDNRQGYPLPTD